MYKRSKRVDNKNVRSLKPLCYVKPIQLTIWLWLFALSLPNLNPLNAAHNISYKEASQDSCQFPFRYILRDSHSPHLGNTTIYLVSLCPSGLKVS